MTASWRGLRRQSCPLKTANEQCIEHVFYVPRYSGIAADQSDTVTAAHLVARAGYGHIEIANTPGDDAACKRCHPIRVTRAHAENDLAGSVAERRQKLFLDDVLNLLSIEYRKNDAARGFGQIGNRWRGAAADVREPRSAHRISVEPDDGNAGHRRA